MIKQKIFSVETKGRGTTNITAQVEKFITDSDVHTGLCHVFVRHTSASLILCENADPTVRSDLEAFMARLVPDGDALFEHILEGEDDMPAHIRTILSHSDIHIPVIQGRCGLGTWQGVFLWEHRSAGHTRQVVLTLIGD